MQLWPPWINNCKYVLPGARIPLAAVDRAEPAVALPLADAAREEAGKALRELFRRQAGDGRWAHLAAPSPAGAVCGGQGVRCNCICPGTVGTPSLQDRINSYADPVQARQDFINRQPMGRLAQAAEIEPIVTFLASDESIFATGIAYMVDGGMTI